MTPLESVGTALIGAAVTGLLTWVVLKYLTSRSPEYTPVDSKQRIVDKYMEKAKQGMK